MPPTHTASDLVGRTMLITGATSGIGRATAAAVAVRGARVVLAVRDTARGQTVADSLAPASQPHVVRELNLASLASVRRFAAETAEPIDVLVNNAGVSSSTLQYTTDGFELQIGTNHVGHFVLTTLLLPQVTSRIVTLASQAERMARLDLDDLSWQRRPYDGGQAYADSKLANLLFTLELNRRLRDAASPVRAMAAHPGLVATAMYDRPAGQKPGIWDRLMPIIGQSPDAGALPVLHAATAELPSGTFTGPRHLFHMRGGAEVINRSARARDADLAARLWTTTEKLVATDQQ